MSAERPAPEPELRQDPLSGDWVIVAPGRGARPQPSVTGPTPCPFCPGNESLTPPPLMELRGGGAAEWSVRVVENLYPIVTGIRSDDGNDHSALFSTRTATGVHEVIIETPDHGREMAAREPDELLQTLIVYRARLQATMARTRIRYAVVFKNKGPEAGTSMPHPHSQLVGLDAVPPAVRRSVDLARRHYRRTSCCLTCDLISAERQASERLVLEQAGFIALAPFAPKFAGEIHVYPLQHAACFTAASDEALAALSRVLLRLLREIDDALGQPSYNLILRTAPKPWRQDPALHWSLAIVPRVARLGGFELATGVNIDPTPLPHPGHSAEA